MTLLELRNLIVEWINPLPDKEEITARIQSCRYDSQEMPKVMSLLLKRFPPSSRLMIASLQREVASWITGKSSFNKVVNSLDALYASVQKKKRYDGKISIDGSRF